MACSRVSLSRGAVYTSRSPPTWTTVGLALRLGADGQTQALPFVSEPGPHAPADLQRPSSIYARTGVFPLVGYLTWWSSGGVVLVPDAVVVVVVAGATVVVLGAIIFSSSALTVSASLPSGASSRYFCQARMASPVLPADFWALPR